MSIKKLIGKKIKKLRIAHGMTQEELSEKIDISQRALSSIETGVNFLSADTLDKITKELKISVSDLFYVEHLQEPDVLIIELENIIRRLKHNPIKLQEVYKIVKVILSEEKIKID